MIWILGNEKRINSYENQKMIEVFGKNGLFLDTHFINILKDSNQTKYFYKQKEINKPHKVLTKLGCMLDEHAKEILLCLKLDGIKLINDVDLLEITSNKFLTAIFLKRHKIEHIKTLKVISEMESIKEVVNNNFTYPIILKSKVGSLGKGIYKINDEESLLNITEQINLINKSYDFLIQEYIETGNITYRVVLLGGKIKYILKNQAQGNGFKSNYTINENVEFIYEPYDKQLVDIVNEVYKAIPLHIMGIDIIKKGDGSYLVCEINSNPGFRAINNLGNKFEEVIQKYIDEI